MAAERSADWVRRWVRLYTRGLPDGVRRERIEEIDDDLWSQLHEAANRSADRTLAGDITARLVLGIPADLSWRMEQRRVTTSSAAPARSPTMFARVISGMAIVGGVAWAIWLPIAFSLAESGWGSQLWLLMMAFAIVGSVGLSTATIALVFANLDRLKSITAILGAIGAAGGLLMLGEFFAGGLVMLPIGSAIVMLDLARIRIVNAWLARLLAAAGLASTVPAFVLLASQGIVANGIPYAALLVTVIVYSISWIPLGWSLRGGGWMPTEPAAQA